LRLQTMGGSGTSSFESNEPIEGIGCTTHDHARPAGGGTAALYGEGRIDESLVCLVNRANPVNTQCVIDQVVTLPLESIDGVISMLGRPAWLDGALSDLEVLAALLLMWSDWRASDQAHEDYVVRFSSATSAEIRAAAEQRFEHGRTATS
jgi:hypothetical protein